MIKIASESFKLFLSQNILFLFRRAKNKDVIFSDLTRWQRFVYGIPDRGAPEKILVLLFRGWPEYRNLFYYRLKKDPITKHFIFFLTRRIFPPREDVVINAIEGIGPGLFIQHGRATGIMAQRVGENCFINQHVSIGYKGINERPPIIGKNVAIRAGAKIYGNIEIGDNVVIGANAVVVKDVPADCTVVGVPGRIIKRNGKRVDEPL